MTTFKIRVRIASQTIQSFFIEAENVSEALTKLEAELNGNYKSIASVSLAKN